MIVFSPVPGHTGEVVGAYFIDGEAEVEEPTALAYFRRHGYGMGEPPAAPWSPSPIAPRQPRSELWDGSVHEELIGGEVVTTRAW